LAAAAVGSSSSGIDGNSVLKGGKKGERNVV